MESWCRSLDAGWVNWWWGMSLIVHIGDCCSASQQHMDLRMHQT